MNGDCRPIARCGRACLAGLTLNALATALVLAWQLAPVAGDPDWRVRPEFRLTGFRHYLRRQTAISVALTNHQAVIRHSSRLPQVLPRPKP